MMIISRRKLLQGLLASSAVTPVVLNPNCIPYKGFQYDDKIVTNAPFIPFQMEKIEVRAKSIAIKCNYSIEPSDWEDEDDCGQIFVMKGFRQKPNVQIL